MTAHGAQGKTLKAAIIELEVGDNANNSHGIVVTSRVRDRSSILILRPFERERYCQGHAEGPSNLLRTLAGEEIDWPAIRAANHPTAVCSDCYEVREMRDFSHAEWDL
eukprot:810269-Prorocentrum_lima.AAC.1